MSGRFMQHGAKERAGLTRASKAALTDLTHKITAPELEAQGKVIFKCSSALL